ncbi:MAG TPA: hypothetical protein VJK52_04750 [Candidatus Nanoarchaeia archaeon]|nr:hypothetical protein [Candidatus Nanoarchaeia archaeon]
MTKTGKDQDPVSGAYAMIGAIVGAAAGGTGGAILGGIVGFLLEKSRA